MFATLICYCPSEGGYSPNDLKCAVFPKPTFHQNPKVTKKKNKKLDNAPQPSKESYKYIARKGKRQREKQHVQRICFSKVYFAFKARDCLMAAMCLTLS